MPIEDKLQIILITYNRAKHVQKTFEQFFFDSSPVSDCEFIVQDNNSTDNTQEIVKEFAKTHPNVKYVKNKYNLGIGGTIARAMERANKDYVWIIGDDDKFDFSNWNEVENAINNNEKIICLANYAIPEAKKDNLAYQLFQMTFITGGIYSTSLFNDTSIRNVFDNIYTLFPHIPPIIQFLNDGGKIYVTKKAISDNGMDLRTDCSYTRGVTNRAELYDRTNSMSWILGYSNIISLLKDRKLQKECLEAAVPYKHIHGSWRNFYNFTFTQYANFRKINYLYEIFSILSAKRKLEFVLYYPVYILKTIYANTKSAIIKLSNNIQKIRIQTHYFNEVFSILSPERKLGFSLYFTISAIKTLFTDIFSGN